MKILVLKNEPKSCQRCSLTELDEFGILYCPIIKGNVHEFDMWGHPQCPLISIDIDELEAAVKEIEDELTILDPQFAENEEMCILKCGKELNTIKSLIEKLKGVK